jgi:hypothetical protein
MMPADIRDFSRFLNTACASGRVAARALFVVLQTRAFLPPSFGNRPFTIRDETDLNCAGVARIPAVEGPPAAFP